MSFDTKAFRKTLGAFPTGVVVVTATGESEPVGITVNSFASVSLAPPLVLWCLKKDSARYGAFAGARGFTVSVLAAGHRSVSSRLARQGEHRLEGLALLSTELGPPALADSLAVFECLSEAIHDGGDHSILIGRVARFFRAAKGTPLVFYGGRYGSLAQADLSPAESSTE
jgi:flavin reductase (DIM6/NTAB) family NADH-FMN oxidoreductase RutF